MDGLGPLRLMFRLVYCNRISSLLYRALMFPGRVRWVVSSPVHLISSRLGLVWFGLVQPCDVRCVVWWPGLASISASASTTSAITLTHSSPHTHPSHTARVLRPPHLPLDLGGGGWSQAAGSSIKDNRFLLRFLLLEVEWMWMWSGWRWRGGLYEKFMGIEYFEACERVSRG